jgi:GH43 family beta-xylosidase
MNRTEHHQLAGHGAPGVPQIWLLGIVATLVPPFAAGQGAAPVDDFYNVLVPSGADPWVIRHTNGQYYTTYTEGDRVAITRSRTLSGLGGGERKVVWTPPATGPASREIWAPELHFLRGHWYLYVAADDGANERHRMWVLENPAADPFEGAFVLKGKLAPPGDDHWAIDGSVFSIGDRLYYVWSGWPGEVDVEQVLYIAPLGDPWTVAGPRVAISRPEFGWETVGHPNVNEGPQALLRDGRIHLIYSASGAWTGSYCLGRLTARLDADPLDSRSWEKAPWPVFRGGNGVVAPGHCSFVRSPDDREDWIVYHASKYRGSAWDRVIRAQPFTWDPDGLPHFGLPSPPDRPVRLPGGEGPRFRLEIEGHAVPATQVVADPTASGGRKLARIRGSMDLGIATSPGGPCALAIRYANNTPDRGRPNDGHVRVNDQDAGTVPLSYTGGQWLVSSLRINLRDGDNTIRLTTGERAVDLDCLDVIRDP